jgi:thiol:disulfide interchange protein
VLDVPNGFHIPSHTPSLSNLIPFDLTVSGPDSVQLLPPVYPAGTLEDFPPFGKGNAYTGRTIVYIPLTVRPSTASTQITIEGTLDYQICNAQNCYNVKAQPFFITAGVVSATQPALATADDLFRGFDPKAFTAAASANSSPTSGPDDAVSFDFFGKNLFSLGRGGFAIALPLALLVGLLFNLMPCVLPVLPLKAIGFYETSQHDRGRSLLLGAVFSLGLLAAFGVLAQLVVVSHWIVWSQQFSSPTFAWIIVAILTIMALGMFGAFNVILPTSVYNLAPRHDTLIGNFLFGGLTALLSTPCTAPMFAGLLLWAEKQEKWLGVATIMTVGLGMALPYLVLSALPELARKLPRAGAWSEVLKQMMGFLLLAAAAFFGAGQLIAGPSFLWVVFAVVAAAAVFLVVRTAQLSPRIRPVTISTVVAAILLGTSFWVVHRMTWRLIDWQPFSDAAVAEARASGRPVLIDFTANWCGNCQAIDLGVYHDQRTADVIKARRITMFRADLTSGDAPGWKLLTQLNASGGIPLTAIYFPGQDKPVMLTSVYTTQNLLQIIQ